MAADLRIFTGKAAALPVIPLGASYLTFQSYAFQVNSSGGHNNRFFNALCGDDPPTITDGYAKWTTIDRPLRQGVTVPQGFNPAQLKISIRMGIWDARFDYHGWDTSARAAAEVEANVDDLHWMAGGNALAGPSPIVYVDSYRTDTKTTTRSRLMPRQYWGVGWVINGGIEWGTSYRHRNGSRIYQEAVFTMLGYSSLGVSPPAQQHKYAGGFFKTNAQNRTALAIAASQSGHTPPALQENLARAILKSPRNNPCHGTRVKLERRSMTWQMPLHLDVWVPSHHT